MLINEIVIEHSIFKKVIKRKFDEGNFVRFVEQTFILGIKVKNRSRLRPKGLSDGLANVLGIL